MSYWAKIKAAAFGSELADVNKPKTQPQPPQMRPAQPPANPGVMAPASQAPVPAPTQTPLSPAVDPNQLHEEAIKRERQTNDGMQSTLEDTFDTIAMGFIAQQPDIYQQYKTRDHKFDVALGEFFKLPDRDSGGKAWYRLLIQYAKEKFPTPQAIKKWMQVDPDSVAAAVKNVVDSQPAAFAQMVSQFSHKADSQYGGKGGISLDQGSGADSEKSLGNFVDTEGGDAARVDQMQDDDYAAPDEDYTAPSAEDIAKFWTRKTKNEIIAPEMSPAEQQEMDATLQAIIGGNADKFHDLQFYLTNDAQQDGASIFQSIDPAKRQKVFGEGIKWVLKGISDSTQEGSPIALTNWQEFLIKHGGKTVQEVVQLAQQAAAGNTTPLQETTYELGEALTDPEHPNYDAMSTAFFQFAQEKATQYMSGANEIDRTAKLFEQSDFRPTPHDISSFKRMAQIAYGCSLREYRYKKVHSEADSKDGAGTALRRGAYVKHKINSIIGKLDSLYQKQPDGSFAAKPDNYVPFGVDERKGKQRYLHCKNGPDGKPLFYIRTVMFDPRIPITNDNLHKYISSPINAPKDEPLDQALTMFNFAKIASMVDSASYAPKMMEDIQKIDPAGLKKPKKDSENLTPLQQKLSLANAEWIKQNPQSSDRLQMWRKQLGDNVKQFVDAAGGTDEVIAKIAANKKKIGGARISNPMTNKGWLDAIINGTPTDYSASDFATLAQFCGVAPEQVYGEYVYEYDKHNKDDHNTLSAQMFTAPAVFGRYFVHRKRIQQQRGFNENNWGNKSIAAFMHMNNAHKLFSSYHVPSKGGPASEATGIGGPLMDATNNEFPLHDVLPSLKDKDGNPLPGEVDQDITTPEQAQELINRMNRRDVPRTDIYEGLRPTSPKDTQLRPDNKGGFHETEVEADPIVMYDTILKSYKAANPDAADLGPEGILERMKQEKIQELQQTLDKKQHTIQTNTQALNDPQAVMDAAQDEVQISDSKVQGLINDLTKKKDFSEQAQQQVSQLALQRLHEMAQKNNMAPEQFAKVYVERKIKQDQASIESAKVRINQLQALNMATDAPKPFVTPDGKRIRKNKEQDEADRQKLKTMMDTVIPLKYKTRVHSNPGEPGTGLHPSFKPLDFVHQKQFSPVEAEIIDLTIKTATSMDKLSAIRNRFIRLSMPTEIVDEMIDGIDAEYEKQLVIIARRYDARRDAATNDSTTSSERRRMWSLL